MTDMSDTMTLVTGAGGFLGRRLCEQLARQGRRVLAQILPGEAQPPCQRCIALDIRDPAEVQELRTHPIDGIYHLAAHASVPESVDDPRNDLEVNVVGTFNLLELARQVSPEFFLFTSTVSVLDGANELPLDERAFCGPSAPYPAAKMAGEGYCRAYCRSYGLPTKIVRFFNVYGPGIRRLVVHDLILKLLHDPSRLEIFGDGNQVRDFLHVDDAVAGMHLVAEKGAPGELYHVGSGQPVSIRQLIAVIANQLNLTDLKIVSVGNSWKGDMPQWYADPSKVQELGFNTSVDLPTGVAETIEWIRQNELDGCQ